eukprot:6833656-Prymnesium_polylepis.3
MGTQSASTAEDHHDSRHHRFCRCRCRTMRLEPCRVYLHDPAAAAAYVVPPRYTPKAWRYNKYSQELWIREALRAGHPWRVHSPQQADLIVLATDFSLLCVAHKVYAQRHLWQLILNDTLLCNGTATGRKLELTKGNPHCQALTAPKLLPLTSAECKQPWVGWGSTFGPPSRPPRDFLFLLDHAHIKTARSRMI